MTRDYDSDNWVCKHCVGDVFLKAEFDGEEVATCEYCKKTAECMSLSDLAKRIDDVYRSYFVEGEEYPVFHAGSDKPWYQMRGDTPTEIIAEIVQCDEPLADHIVTLLSNEEAYDVHKDGATAMYDDTCCYKLRRLLSIEEELVWDDFTERIKHDTRFFSERLLASLDELLGNLGELELENHERLLRKIAPGSAEGSFVRARRADSKDVRLAVTRDPARHLGTPPPDTAAAGRMNPAGIPVFYGADSEETCIAELRPLVGSRVLTGRFEITRPFQVLDLTALGNAGAWFSVFDPHYDRKTTRVQFLQQFQDKIVRPILPDDEALEYLSTQALAEYFRDHYSPTIDAIFYRSVQSGTIGTNIAVLGTAANVDMPDLEAPKDGVEAEISEIETDDSYTIGPFRYARMRSAFGDAPNTPRVNGLRFVPDSLRLHVIESASYSTAPMSVEYMTQKDWDDLPF